MQSRYEKLKSRLQIWSLQFLVWFVQSRGFRILMWPIVRLFGFYVLWAVLFDRLPKFAGDNPEVAKMIAGWAEVRKAHVQPTAMLEKDRVYIQTQTWGVAGVAVVILTAIVGSHISAATPEIDISLLIGAGCLAFVIPTLIMLGFVYLAAADPKQTPLTVQQTISLLAAVWAAHAIFVIGFAALLWSMSWIISLIFIAACYRAWRRFGKHAISLHPVPPAAPVAEKPKEAVQVPPVAS